MPPEQAMGLAKKVDAQSDVWSLGATLFHVLSGQSVHIANDMKAMLLASSSARPRSLADAAPELSSKVVAVVDRALSYMKAERWPDMVSMRTAWQEAHPHWLSTLPPPRFTADPSFLDPSLLEAASTPSEPRELFDPRELLDEPVPAQKHPGALPRRATPPPALPRAPEPERAAASLGAQVRGAALSGNERPHERSPSLQQPVDEPRSPVTTAAAQRSRKWKPVAVAAGVTVLVATLGATMTELGPWYQSLRQPGWKPPDAWFGPGWTVIFACAAASASTAWRDVRDRASRERVVVLFTANSFFNLLWSALFFRFQRPDWALVEVVLLWLSILALIVYLARRSRPASLILLPYLAWVTFAGALNAAVVALNPHG
jgi:tryptophan-rich sensory protein